MSFSSDIRIELAEHMPKSRHCQIAQLAAFFLFCGQLIRGDRGHYYIKIQTENFHLAKKCFTLIQKTFNITPCVSIRDNAIYKMYVRDEETVRQIIGALKLTEGTGSQIELLTRQNCCGRAYICGAFMCAGSVSNPQNFYHYEIVCDSEENAVLIAELINSLAVDEPLEAKVTARKKHFIVYVKEGSQIAQLLNLMGAHKALMEMENFRALKEMRNGINRRVNCETANINKTVSAALKQIQDIQYIKDNGGFAKLSDVLLEMAELRLEYPEATLKELGEMTDPPVGKSGVNHRLRKLGEIAERMQGIS